MVLPEIASQFYSYLRTQLVVDRGVTLRVRAGLYLDGDKCFGLTMWSAKGRATIQIDTSHGDSVAFNTLMHEYAHAWSGDCTHGPSWAAAYGEVYRVWEKWNESKEA